jgi:hypothetical protein
MRMIKKKKKEKPFEDIPYKYKAHCIHNCGIN